MTVAERVAAILDRIDAASMRRLGRECPVMLLAAAKEREAAEIEEAIAAGVRFLGENKVQEGGGHMSSVAAEAKGRASWHFIGRLQSNKAKKAVQLFDSIDSVDSSGLAERLDAAAGELGKCRECMVEVNMGEEQKGGVGLSGIASLCDAIHRSPHLTLTGLMAIPPFFDDPEQSRPYFRKLRELFDDVKKDHPEPDRFAFLSMGMSGDFEAAIEEGSTMVRIGTALFGPRRQR